MTRKQILVVAGIGVLGALSVGVAIVAADGETVAPTSTIAQPSEAPIGKLPVAPASARVDLAQPSFSHPTGVVNPLHPTSELASELLLGKVDGEPFRVEITLLPETKTVEWQGRRVETVVAQYVAYLDGRIHEVALDFYAQADDGSVWYFGEDVFNYEDGEHADTDGTWLAGVHGPAAMIMPADPRVGDVYRPENIPGFVFEEVTVKAVDDTVQGPRGPISGALVVEELHMDGAYEAKIFAPGYGEFSTGSGRDIEALALALPIDALPRPMPTELERLSKGAAAVFGAAASGGWKAASAGRSEVAAAWAALRKRGVPPLLESATQDAVGALSEAVNARDPARARLAAIEVAQAGLDLQLRHRPPVQVDIARLDLRAVRLIVGAESRDMGAVRGDFVTLEWIRDRVVPALDAPAVFGIDRGLDELRAALNDEDASAARRAAVRFRTALARIDTGAGALTSFQTPTRGGRT